MKIAVFRQQWAECKCETHAPERRSAVRTSKHRAPSVWIYRAHQSSLERNMGVSAGAVSAVPARGAQSVL